MKNKTKKEYNQISKKELLENDKILIINKFGFVPIFKKTNSAQNKKNIQLNLNTNLTLSSFQTQKNNKNINLIKSNSTLLLTKKEGRNYNQYKPSITNASTTTNFYSSFYNSKNKLNLNNKSSNNIKKEKNLINSCLWNKLIKNIDQNRNNKINNMKNQIMNNTNEIYNSNITKTEKEKEKYSSKKRIKPIIKVQQINPIKIKEFKSFNDNDIENKSSNYENNNEYKKSNVNNNTNNILDEFSDSEKEKNNIFIKNKNYFYENKNINMNNNFNNINFNKNMNIKSGNNNKIKDNMTRLIMSQDIIEGAWNENEETKKLISIITQNKFNNIKNKVKGLNKGANENKIIFTILVIYYLGAHHSDKLNDYRLVINKAKKFLMNQGIQYEDFIQGI